jgi:hypothetical protein
MPQALDLTTAHDRALSLIAGAHGSRPFTADRIKQSVEQVKSRIQEQVGRKIAQVRRVGENAVYIEFTALRPGLADGFEVTANNIRLKKGLPPS